MLKIIAPALFIVVASGTAAMAQTSIPAVQLQREAQLERLRPGAERMRQFEAHRRMSEYSPVERDRVRRRAETLITQTNTTCSMVNAVDQGRTERRREIVEVSCASGLGFLLVDGAQPTAYDCWTIAQAAQVVRAENPRANVGTLCSLPENGG